MTEKEKTESNVKIVGLLGFGKVGQALAAQILDHGHKLFALDRDPTIALSLENSCFETSEPGIAQSITEAFENGRLSIGSQYAKLSECSAVIICIPLLVSEASGGRAFIDYGPFDDCIKSLAEFVHDRMLVCLETTVPVGTCRQRMLSIFSKAGKTHGIDYLLSFSPERIMSNTMREQLNTLPKIVAALTPDALKIAEEFYKSFIPTNLVQTVSSIETAEMIKLSAMVSRDLNLAFINQLAIYCEAASIDISEVLSLVNTDKVSNLLLPGIGVGGHCTPVYPYFLIENFAEEDIGFELASEARRINDSMAEHLVNSICDDFEIERVIILGLGFRANVKEDTCSPAYLVEKALRNRRVKSFLFDPLYSEAEITRKGFQYLCDPYATECDALILVTAHEHFADLDFQRLANQGCKLVLDGRNALDRNKILQAGMTYRGVGTRALSPEGIEAGKMKLPERN